MSAQETFHTNRRRFLAAALAAPLVPGAARAQERSAHNFGWKDEHFLLDGKPFLIRSGSMHYPRVPRAYWRDRMRKMKALGLNTLCTYVFWDLHEPHPGQFDFSGNLDLAEYLRIAHGEGLWVLLRPGPYICSEWDFGGLPPWLLADPAITVRSADPKFLSAAGRYLERVGREVRDLQITHGGPILMVQVENEYGSFGSDKAYLGAIRRMIQDAGFDVTLYTSDGSGKTNLAGGTLDGVLSVINFGDTSNPEREFTNFAAFRQNVPRMCGEFWVGWFDHWGERHHTTPPARGAQGLEWMLSRGISANLYMVHGGSSFGFMSGANNGRVYEPDISGYDYDSPLDEAGRPTAKFHALREVLGKYAGGALPDLPAPLPMIAIPRFELRESASLAARLGEPLRAPAPVTMEAAGQSYGYILYRKRIGRAFHGPLEVAEVRDYAVVSQGGKVLGTLDRRLHQTRLDIDLAAGEPLDILVENMGRTNFGPLLTSDRKGIAGKVTLDGEEVKDWEIYRLPMDDPARWPFSAKPASGPALHRGVFHLAKIADTFLDLRGWGKGVVWVNGHNLGRYWKIGPQQSLFVPAPWLSAGANQAIVLDLEEGGPRSLAGMTDPVYDTPGAHPAG
ncbi:MAG TPA: beta-galactosidase family protein [Bryobacteraceae bacterium]|nr:beta-galactosidase family protein [Bryobacteraceae bacterium]